MRRGGNGGFSRRWRGLTEFGGAMSIVLGKIYVREWNAGRFRCRLLELAILIIIRRTSFVTLGFGIES